MKYFASASPKALEAALSQYGKTATIEAEYGEKVVEGNTLTLAHHGSRSNNPAPCEHEPRFMVGECICGDGHEAQNCDLPYLGIEVTGLSHLDLDALGGCMALELRKGVAPGEFWRVAAYVDKNGPHKLTVALKEFDEETADWLLARFNAWYAWSESNRLNLPRRKDEPEDSLSLVVDVTDYVHKAMDVLNDIMAGEQGLLGAGETWHQNLLKLEKESFRGMVSQPAPVPQGALLEYDSITIERWKAKRIYLSTVLLREKVRGSFVNALYGHGHLVYKAIVSHDPENGIITLSFDGVDLDASQIMKEVFGPLAGGHKGIAGTPRDQQYSFDNAMELARKVSVMLRGIDKRD